MIKLAKKYPKYRWHKNFGYGTDDHLNELKKNGLTILPNILSKKECNNYIKISLIKLIIIRIYT